MSWLMYLLAALALGAALLVPHMGLVLAALSASLLLALAGTLLRLARGRPEPTS